MTDAKDAALDKAIEAFHKAWPGFRKWFASTDLAEIPPEPFEAAIAAYLAALPKGELAERLLEMRKRMCRAINVSMNLSPHIDDCELLLAAAAMLSVPEGWVSAESAPREWEGGLVWQYSEWNGEIKLQPIPHNYSRNPHHCRGVWFIPIKVPARPDQFAENANCPPGTGGGPVMETPDFERMAEEFFPVGITQTLEGADSIVMDKNGDGLRRLLSEMLQSVHNNALEEAAEVVDAHASDIMDGSSGRWLAGKVRALKDTTATKEDGNAGADES